MNHFYLRVKPALVVKLVISISKKVSKKAVIRNRIRRRVRAIIREIIPELKPAEYYIVARPEAERIKGKELESELNSLVVSCRL